MEARPGSQMSYPETIKVGFSPCPNDTFIFGALAQGLFTPRLRYETFIQDVETLNELALEGKLPLTKLSFGVFPAVISTYELLPVGAALGFGCGPLLVARKKPVNLARIRIAVPGLRTTAYLLLRFYLPELGQVVPLRYEKIIPAVVKGEVEAGLLIHEGRFVYQQYGLTALVDLGKWWEKETRLPLPLGGVFIKRDLPYEIKRAVLADLRESLNLARKNKAALWDFIRENAQELNPEVINKHLETFVNHYTYDLGEQGRKAVEVFLKWCQSRGLLEDLPQKFLFDGEAV